MGRKNILGEFLRARREALNPVEVGLLHSGPRRTPGLRREEVAMFAGMSTDYYIRLEQGRERHPSEQVIGALVRALRLDPDAAAYLHELAHPGPRRGDGDGQVRQVSPEVLRLIDSWPYTPALVIDRCMDVLAANRLAVALFAGQEHAGNLMRMVFPDSATRSLYREFGLDWEAVAHAKVARLRTAAGADLDDPRLVELVGELSRRSPEFRRLWARQDVSHVPPAVTPLRHRVVGDMLLSCEVFDITSSPGQQLVIVHAEPSSPSEQALIMLGCEVMASGRDAAGALLPMVRC